MAISPKLVQMARDATIGMTDAEVVGKTGISFATWRKWLDGYVPSERTVLQFCSGLGLDAQPFLRERSAVVGTSAQPDQIMVTALELQPLTADSKRLIMQLYRERLEVDGVNTRAA